MPLDHGFIRSPGEDGTDTLILVAPLDGWASSLREVPDPVFADKMMGDGIAIDPTGSELCAPCAGEVILLHAAGHAITLRAENGAEILMHVGLDTVALGGEGFTAHVRQGERVAMGAKLISFNLDRLARTAKSLITPLVVTNGEHFAVTWRCEDQRVLRGQELMRLRALTRTGAPSIKAAQEVRAKLVIPLAHGLHARPAARFAGVAKSFSAEIAIVFGERRANARSPVALMGLGLTHGAAVELVASGDDASDALAALRALLEGGMDEKTDAPAALVSAILKGTPEPGVIHGVMAVPGMALGRAVHFARADISVEEQGKGAAHEADRLKAAIGKVRTALHHAAGQDPSDILAAHLAFLDDPELHAHATQSIGDGKSAGFAWRAAIEGQVMLLQALDESRFAERAADLLDLERQVLVAMGEAQAGTLELPEGAIVVADDLLPSEFLGLEPARLEAIALAKGGPTSHVAILAGAMNIPMLVACGPELLSVPEGATLLLEAEAGALRIDPALSLIESARTRIGTLRERESAARALAHQPCRTRDGVRIDIQANLGSLSDAVVAVAAGAEGCGLLRTEFLFLDREAAPDEAEQMEVYRAIAEALNGRPLTVRTLDIGADKPAPYLPLAPEENPALGLRGVRVSLWRPDLLAVQLRAILQAVPAAQCRIMVPMITGRDELREVRRALDRARAELGIGGPIPLGVMIETPAAAMTADLLSAEADFLSIGTNDLTQYCLAMDRGNAELASRFDALHPAVLRLIAATAEGASRHGRPVSVCGGLASEVLAAPILLGLGVRGLSATASQIPALKSRIHEVTLDQCRDVAEKALAAASAADVRTLALTMGET